ncbi:hypothetical protein ACFSBZ_16395 [Amnibacterium flavum]|uniref:Uncharacterized protein n=1 Tax=Amnibacterium flavum TaxID=2173173 RepID=A0A2V1HKV4_9MICO|nr:hypothetical protein [Amnibacterium flavum]PVZ93266.1 hypothetical protein DDQ50_16330 [Amnibacterium flavum]
MTGSAFSQAFRAQLTPVFFLTALVLILGPLAIGIVGVQGGALRNNVDLYGEVMGSAVVLVAPLLAVLIGCLPLFSATRRRVVGHTRTDLDPEVYLGTKAVAAVTCTFVVFFLSAFLPYLLLVLVWPSLGNPGIDPSLYGLTAEEGRAAAQSAASYTQLLSIGEVAYGVIYGAWVGLGGATYCLLGLLALIVVPNRYLALTLPFVIYVLQSLVWGLIGFPTGALLFSLYPFGLEQQSIASAAAPTLLLMVIASVNCWLLRERHFGSKL